MCCLHAACELIFLVEIQGCGRQKIPPDDCRSQEGASRRPSLLSSYLAQFKLESAPWYQEDTTTEEATKYLKDTPQGAFVIRKAPNRPNDLALSVQAGPKVCHVLLRGVDHDGKTYKNVSPTAEHFEHVYDLVKYCHHEPFHFKAIDEKENIYLLLDAAKEADAINQVTLQCPLVPDMVPVEATAS